MFGMYVWEYRNIIYILQMICKYNYWTILSVPVHWCILYIYIYVLITCWKYIYIAIRDYHGKDAIDLRCRPFPPPEGRSGRDKCWKGADWLQPGGPQATMTRTMNIIDNSSTIMVIIVVMIMMIMIIIIIIMMIFMTMIIGIIKQYYTLL